MIYPIYILLPQAPAATGPVQIQPPLLSPSPLQPPPTLPAGSQFTQEDLDRLEDNLTRQFDERFDELDERLADRPARVLLPEDAPSVVQVEGALLEAGLFQTTAILFEFDRSTLLPVSERTLNVVGEVLVRHPEVNIEVAGHTDSAGPEDYNLRLSRARAMAVRGYLLDRFALAPERIEANGYGEAQPVASNATETGRVLNRRVEFRVLNPEIAEEPF